jgi:hypothetical protein
MSEARLGWGVIKIRRENTTGQNDTEEQHEQEQTQATMKHAE